MQREIYDHYERRRYRVG